MDFAKVFNTRYGQILITNDTREDEYGNDLPSINAFFKVSEDFGICEISAKLPINDWRKCDEFFNDMTEDRAVKMVEKTILSLR